MRTNKMACITHPFSLLGVIIPLGHLEHLNALFLSLQAEKILKRGSGTLALGAPTQKNVPQGSKRGQK